MPKVFPEYKNIVRMKITEAALKIFSEKGYHESKMDEIAREAKLSKPTLYKYFKSKEDILVNISETSIALTENSLSINNRDLRQIFDELYDMFLKSKDALHLGYEIASLSAHNENIQKINRQAYQAQKNALTNLMIKQQNNGIIKKDVDIKLVTQLLTAIIGDITNKLVIGCDESKILESWNKSISTILNKIKT